MKNSIQQSRTYNATINQVWQAISDGESISKWFLQADFKAEVGYNYRFDAPDKDDCEPIVGRVLKADPYVLSYTWEVLGTNVETTVTWTLDTTEDGTLVTLDHTGIDNYGGALVIEMFNSFNGGWKNCLEGLFSYLNETVHA